MDTTTTRDDLPGTAPELPYYQVEEVLGEMLPGFESVPRIRYAKCTQCSEVRPITGYVPLWKEQPGEFDRFYCGCRGWN